MYIQNGNDKNGYSHYLACDANPLAKLLFVSRTLKANNNEISEQKFNEIYDNFIKNSIIYQVEAEKSEEYEAEDYLILVKDGKIIKQSSYGRYHTYSEYGHGWHEMEEFIPSQLCEILEYEDNVKTESIKENSQKWKEIMALPRLKCNCPYHNFRR